jgi:hypothetical protein
MTRHPYRLLGAALWTCLASAAAQAATRPVLCAWDILGKSGGLYALAQDYALAMNQQGVDFEVKPYLDERVAAEDFRTGQCAAVVLTGFRARTFNTTSGSLDSMGSATVVKDGRIDMAASYDVLRKMVDVFSSPAGAKLMVEGNYEIGGILPAGAAYPIMRDRSWASAKGLSGKRVGTFDNDKAQALLIQQLGAQAVSVDVTNVGTKFNNGLVDVTHLPAITYKPFELHRGIGTRGAVVRMPVMLPTVQLVLNRSMLPDTLGQPSRTYWLAQYERSLQLVQKAEAEVPAQVWYDVPKEDVPEYVGLLRQGRMMGAEQGLYSKRTLNLMKKARCMVSPANGECATTLEFQ